jgi:hypothetical protein
MHKAIPEVTFSDCGGGGGIRQEKVIEKSQQCETEKKHNWPPMNAD